MLAYFHASGPPHVDLDAGGPTGHFVLTALLVPSAELDDVRAAVERVRELHSPGRSLRASQLAAQPELFERVLAGLAEASFRFYAIAIDPHSLPEDAQPANAEAFHARLAAMLYRQLFTRYPSLVVTAAESGRNGFMGELAEFLLRHHSSSLFDRPSFHFRSPKQEPLLQLVDVIGRAVARTYEPDAGAAGIELLSVLQPEHVLQIDEWPVRYRPAPGTHALRAADASDDDIARFSIAAAEAFIDARSSSIDEDVKGQVLVLARLLFEARFSDPRAYLPTEILRQALAPVGKANESVHWLRSNVIAPLRDAGVLVASSPRGYKIPLSVADVTDFVMRTDTVVHPMLHRVSRARDAVRRITEGRVDVLADGRFDLLRAAVDAAKQTD